MKKENLKKRSMPLDEFNEALAKIAKVPALHKREQSKPQKVKNVQAGRTK